MVLGLFPAVAPNHSSVCNGATMASVGERRREGCVGGRGDGGAVLPHGRRGCGGPGRGGAGAGAGGSAALRQASGKKDGVDSQKQELGADGRRRRHLKPGAWASVRQADWVGERSRGGAALSEMAGGRAAAAPWLCDAIDTRLPGFVALVEEIRALLDGNFAASAAKQALQEAVVLPVRSVLHRYSFVDFASICQVPCSYVFDQNMLRESNFAVKWRR